ncbi:MAG: hypothetical protein IPH02_16525 [Sphingobacteriales bacterium]|nr:hypothetical protein [Sphingobacteriales bacterium]
MNFLFSTVGCNIAANEALRWVAYEGQIYNTTTVGKRLTVLAELIVPENY